MRRISVSNVVLRALGLLLLTAAVLKGHELLTVPMANKDLWSWRPFLIFQVEFELTLGIWLLSGLFKRLAWLAALACFSLFCCVTLYKGLTGAASCGCFGRVHVNPWITLSAIDLPSVVILALFRPAGLRPQWLFLCLRSPRRRILAFVRQFFKPLPSLAKFTGVTSLGLAMLGMTTPILAISKPARVTTKYEILEPKTWVGKELPILKYIDIADQLKQGTWLVLFYHHNCPECQKAIRRYERMARELKDKNELLRVAMIEVPPCAPNAAELSRFCLWGRLFAAKEWFVTTPATALVRDRRVTAVWEIQVPDLKSILVSLREVSGTKHPAGSHSVTTADQMSQGENVGAGNRNKMDSG